MSTYRPYPAYKESGVEWIGVVPEHWRLVPLKAVSRILNGATPKSGEASYWGGDIAWYTPADLDSENPSWLGDSSRYLTHAGLESCAARLAPPGSVVLSIRAPVGSIGITQTPATTNQGCRTLVPANSLSAEHLANLLVASRKELSIRSNGTTFQELSGQALASIKVPLPPLNERPTLLASIQRETARIDALIEKKSRFIELLKEKRQALITQAVTKGLDPTAPMKDSGVEWIGEVPAHWKVAVLKRAVMLQRGHDLPDSARKPGNIPVVSSGGVIATHERAMAHAPGIVTGRYGSVGQFSYVDTDYWPLNTALYSVDLRGNYAKFVWYLLQSIAHLFVMHSTKSAVPGIDRNDVHRELVAIPGVVEQSDIAAFLDESCMRLDTLQSRVQRSIDLLKERRSALITAAVTGQIDLREGA